MGEMKRDTLTMEALRVIMSHFCKARGIFRDECFVQKRNGEDGEMVSVLKKPPSGDYGAEQLYNLLEFGVAECLDRECLRSVSLCIVRSQDGVLLEELTLECEATRSEYSQMSVADAVRELTRKHRLLVQTLSPLQEETAFKVRLSLIGAKMPYRAWTPPFFVSQSQQRIPRLQQFNSSPVTLKIGKLTSDRETCILAIRSVHDTLEKLESLVANQPEPSRIAFDPVFTHEPGVKTLEKAIEEPDVDLYQMIKTFVTSDKTPSMKRTYEAHRNAGMPTIRTYFHQLCDEGILERRGFRFYPSKPKVASLAARTCASSNLKPIEKATPATQRGPALAHLLQKYKGVRLTSKEKIIRHAVPPATHLAISRQDSYPSPKTVAHVSTQRFGRLITVPIVQNNHPAHIQDVCPLKYGHPVFVASKAVIQTAHKPMHRRQKIASIRRKA